MKKIIRVRVSGSVRIMVRVTVRVWGRDRSTVGVGITGVQVRNPHFTLGLGERHPVYLWE